MTTGVPDLSGVSSGRRKRVLFLLPDLRAGGAERVAATYLRELSREHFSPSLALLRKTGARLRDVPSDVPVYDLLKRSRASLPGVVLRFARLLRTLEPDVVVSFLWSADAIQLLTRTLKGAPDSVRNIVFLRNVSRAMVDERYGATKLALMRGLYPRADAFFAVSSEVADESRRIFRLSQDSRIEVHPNPTSVEWIRQMGTQALAQSENSTAPRIVTVGRLDPQKGFDVLLHALSRLDPARAWQLRIVGDGSDRGRLRDQALRLGISQRVSWTGFLENPYPEIQAADLFVSASRYEGFPNAILEAMALGTPVLATSCAGTRELLSNAEDGLLVPPDNPAELARALEQALSDPQRMSELATSAESCVRRYDSKIVVPNFENALLKVIESEAPRG
jgi:glycosyltransferase involved in cell wall biosynthesis